MQIEIVASFMKLGWKNTMV